MPKIPSDLSLMRNYELWIVNYELVYSKLIIEKWRCESSK